MLFITLLVFLDVAVALLITSFLKFHLTMLVSNKTTIEMMEAKRTNTDYTMSPFDNGSTLLNF